MIQPVDSLVAKMQPEVFASQSLEQKLDLLCWAYIAAKAGNAESLRVIEAAKTLYSSGKLTDGLFEACLDVMRCE